MANPVLEGAVRGSGAGAVEDGSPRLDYADVIVKTAILFAVGVVAAILGWMFLPANLFTVLGLGIVTLVIAIIANRQNPPKAPLPLLYAALEGAVLGAISQLFAVRYGADIVVTAIGATLVVFGVCLGVIRIPRVRNSNQGMKAFTIAIIGYLVFSLLSLGAGWIFGVGGGWGFYGLGWLGIGISLLAVGLASWSLVIDFGMADRAVQQGYPEAWSWRLALGLFISTAWLYLEILRLLALSRR